MRMAFVSALERDVSDWVLFIGASGKRQGIEADVPRGQRQGGMRHGHQLTPGAEQVGQISNSLTWHYGSLPRGAKALAGGDGTGNVHAHIGTGDMGIRFAMLHAHNGMVEWGFYLGY
uniref:Uncharacterized protein n=1 Tax=Plectus sambesii TaxID=2011161 RepID=A0A914W2L5_9BILA